LHDRARRGKCDRPDVGCVLVEREVRADLMVVSEVVGQEAVEVSLAKNEHMVQALAPDRPDETLRERILPRAVWRREDLLGAQALHAVPKWLTVDLVAVAEEIGGGGVVRERVHELLSGPGGGGMLGDVEVDDPSAVVGEHDEDEEDAEAS